MSIGTGIVLFVIGAILAFAVNVETDEWIDLQLVGYILMVAGVVAFVLGLIFAARRRAVGSRTTTTEDRTYPDDRV